MAQRRQPAPSTRDSFAIGPIFTIRPATTLADDLAAGDGVEVGLFSHTTMEMLMRVYRQEGDDLVFIDAGVASSQPNGVFATRRYCRYLSHSCVPVDICSRCCTHEWSIYCSMHRRCRRSGRRAKRRLRRCSGVSTARHCSPDL